MHPGKEYNLDMHTIPDFSTEVEKAVKVTETQNEGQSCDFLSGVAVIFLHNPV